MISRLSVVIQTTIRDILLIVTSILIAFFLDAWWDDYVEQKNLNHTLQAMYVDFISTKQELDDVLNANELYIENITSITSLSSMDIKKLDTVSKTKLVNMLPRGGITFDPILGSLDALIASGQLNKINNVKLRNLLGAWPSLMDEIGEDQNILIDMYMAQQERNVELGIYMMSNLNDVTKNLESTDNLTLITIINDAEMLNRLAAHSFAIKSLNDELKEIEDHLLKLIPMLKNEIY